MVDNVETSTLTLSFKLLILFFFFYTKGISLSSSNHKLLIPMLKYQSVIKV